MNVAPKTGASGDSSLNPMAEVTMRGSFNDPVYVQNGRTLVEEICSAEQAIDFMERKRLEAEDLVARVTWQALSHILRQVQARPLQCAGWNLRGTDLSVRGHCLVRERKGSHVFNARADRRRARLLDQISVVPLDSHDALNYL
ncbi:hypothetical protein I6F11_28220 [Ensifer sp. NBAIM29]|nr:hypothetical protein [Ensifer sp. NBAIM29]